MCTLGKNRRLSTFLRFFSKSRSNLVLSLSLWLKCWIFRTWYQKNWIFEILMKISTLSLSLSLSLSLKFLSLKSLNRVYVVRSTVSKRNRHTPPPFIFLFVVVFIRRRVKQQQRLVYSWGRQFLGRWDDQNEVVRNQIKQYDVLLITPPFIFLFLLCLYYVRKQQQRLIFLRTSILGTMRGSGWSSTYNQIKRRPPSYKLQCKLCVIQSYTIQKILRFSHTLFLKLFFFFGRVQGRGKVVFKSVCDESQPTPKHDF